MSLRMITYKETKKLVSWLRSNGRITSWALSQGSTSW